ncbi:matrixin family metalloprotease [Methylobacterium planeticum]|uniref:Matrixin family metalloprotease n=1 Tax=Methylobacterium planeticum TaxID=2615211 RepID=A0A6N6MFW0_9HYPH|nr:matrixin family metalloprotease [Methylobacterium planeticum]KAB1068277.1 matrixin family metalloprotease [Methylobacterium planeticum]
MSIDYELTGSRWGTGAAGTSAGTVTWAADATIEAGWLPQIRAAFADWSRYANIDFKEVAAASTPDIGFTETPIDGPLQYLGYATWTYDARQRLTHATIKIDSAEDYHSVGSTVVASSSPSQDLFHLVLHEIGHAIGIDHRPVSEGLSVMNPNINPAQVKDLTMSDIEAVQALYGVRAGSPGFDAQTGLATKTMVQTPVVAAPVAATPVAATPATATVAVTAPVVPVSLTSTPNPVTAQATPVQAATNLASPDAVFRFFDTKTSDHFYTTSPDEKAGILATLPSFTYEGVTWAVPDKAADTIDVFRFFDTKTSQHFFTTSAGERDTILKTLPTYHYEGVAFQAFAHEGAPGSLTLERFLNTETGLHHFAASQAEASAIKAGLAGTGWVYEGHGFTVAAPTDAMLHL